MNSNKKIFQLLFSQTKDLIFYSFFSVLSALLVVYEVVVLKFYIDFVVNGGAHESTSIFVFMFLAGFIGFVTSIILRSRAKTVLSSTVTMELAKEAYDCMLYSDINEVNKDDTKDKIKNILINSDDIGNKFLRKNFLPFYESMISVIVLFVAMLIIEPILSLFMLVGIPAYFVVSKGLEILIVKATEKNLKSIQKVNEIIERDYNNIRSIKLANSAEFEKAHLDDLLENYQKSKINKYLANNIFNKALQISFNSIVVAIILGLCGFLSADPTYGITSGTVVAYMFMVPYTFYSFGIMIHSSIRSRMIEKQLGELNEIYKLRTEKKNEPVDSLEDIRTIKFKNVSYTNSNSEYIVNNVSFEVKKGEKFGILSFDDETKDALFDLFTKLNRPRSGSILFNDCDIIKVDTKYLRSIITTVFNHQPIVDDSICENIIYPLDFDDYKYNDALYKSGLKDRVNNYSDKDDTNIYNEEIENEVLKRIIYANAFFKDSKIYLLKDMGNEITPQLEL